MSRKPSQKSMPIKSPLDEHVNNEILHRLRNGSQGMVNNQPAQDRLKRLQTHLKKVDSKKHEKKEEKNARSSISNSRNNNNTNCSSVVLSTVIPPPMIMHSKIVTRDISQDLACITTLTSKSSSFATLHQANIPLKSVKLAAMTASTHEFIQSSLGASDALDPMPSKNKYNPWQKPTSLTDAADGRKELFGGRINANERLALLRASLQQYPKEARKKNQEMPQQSVSEIDMGYEEAEPMDWQEVDVIEYKADNKQTIENYDTNGNNYHIAKLRSLDSSTLPARRLDCIYFVLDTNVLMHNLIFVEELTKLKLDGTAGSMLYLPYVVIKELDKLKSSKFATNDTSQTRAIRAIHYLNTKFDESLDIQAQSAFDDTRHLIAVENADDSIINCSLQLKAEVPFVVLLTNDLNIRLKALASDIKVSNRSEVMSKYAKEFAALL